MGAWERVLVIAEYGSIKLDGGWRERAMGGAARREWKVEDGSLELRPKSAKWFSLAGLARYYKTYWCL